MAQQQQPLYAPNQQQVNQQDQQRQQQDQLMRQLAQQRRQEELKKAERRTPGRVTRVVADLMVFVAVPDEKQEIGLVFKPDKIADYGGEPLDEIGVVVGAVVSEIRWNALTLKVSTVVINRRTAPESHGATA